MRVKTVYIADKPKCNLSSFPNFHISGSIKGMKEKYYGKDALLVKCGSYIYIMLVVARIFIFLWLIN